MSRPTWLVEGEAAEASTPANARRIDDLAVDDAADPEWAKGGEVELTLPGSKDEAEESKGVAAVSPTSASSVAKPDPAVEGRPVRYELDQVPFGQKCLCLTHTVHFKPILDEDDDDEPALHLQHRITQHEVDDAVKRLAAPLNSLGRRLAKRERKTWMWLIVGIALLVFGTVVSHKWGHEEFASGFALVSVIVGGTITFFGALVATVLFFYFRCACCTHYRSTKHAISALVATLNKKHEPRGVRWTLGHEVRVIKSFAKGAKRKITYQDTLPVITVEPFDPAV